MGIEEPPIRTEASVSWAVQTLGEFVFLRRGHDLTARERKPGNVPIMGSAGQNGFTDTPLARGPGVVVGRSGASFGQAHYCGEDYWPHNTALYVVDFQGNIPQFVYYLLSYLDFSRHNSGGAQQSLNRNFIAPIQIRVPPIAEQLAIAGTLADVDALLVALDNLIAKKRALKEAAMQQLLTGQIRLAPFTGRWRESSIGCEFHIQLGKMLDAARNVGTPKPYLGNRAVQWGRIDTSDLETVPLSSSEMGRFRLAKGDLLVCEGGEVGRAAIWDQSIDECYYQKALHRLRPIRDYNPSLLLQLLRFWACSAALYKYVTQTSIAHLPREKLAIVPLPVPSRDEQTAIAEVLSDMDAEILALEARRDKTRLLKQGMMQQLLTGRIRLV